MPKNSLFPGFIRLFYNSNAHQHTMTIPVKPFFSGVTNEWFVEQKGQPLGIAWKTILDTYANLLKVFITTTGDITRADLYTMSAPDAEPLFVDTEDLSIAGTGSGSPQSLGQLTISFRSQNGGTYRLQIMEPATTAINAEQFPPFTGGTLALSNWMISSTSFLVARDGGFLVAPIRLLTKTNDHLRKKYLLDA